MKKSTKGAVAAGAAAVLLLGGAGSLAYWTDTATVNGGTLSSGSIELGAVALDGWKHVEDDSPVTKIVPGDEIYNDFSTTLTLVGDHIGATIEIDDAAFGTSPLAAELEPGDVTLTDAAGDPLSSVDTEGVHDVDGKIVVSFPYGAATNASQSGTAILDALTLDAVQTHETP